MRFFHVSSWTTAEEDENGKKVIRRHRRTYRRPKIEGEVTGKKAIKHAKRLKVAAMKAAGHFKGDNRPFAA